MNKIPACVTQIFKQNGCVLLELQCSFGTLHSLILEPCEFSSNDKVIATFKENEIIPFYSTPHTQHALLSRLNTFEAQITDIQTSGFFMRLSLMPIAQNTLDSTRSQDFIDNTESQNITPIYALFPSFAPIDISHNQTCLWHIPSSHILLEKYM